MLKKSFAALALGSMMLAGQAFAADYAIDTKGQHAFVNFKISHLGYSWLWGSFREFDGSFSFDAAKPEASSVKVTLKTDSVFSNHAERDKHLRGSDFLDTGKFPQASFKSTGFKTTGEGTGIITGDFTLHGVTKSISFPVTRIGEGSDPWGGYRAGFEGSTTLTLKDYGIDYNLGPASTQVEIDLYIEGVRQ